MLVARPLDGADDAEPIAHHRDVAERHAGLHHAERPRVHAEQEDFFPAATIAAQVELVRRARVFRAGYRHNRPEPRTAKPRRAATTRG
jgi:hypothetical protein